MARAARARRRPARGLILLLMLVALVALLAGLFYFATPADKIPAWLPGRVATSTAHHVRRATAAIVVGLLCALAAWAVARRPRSARR
jgi:ABC-type Fe3+-siderophore transport system permease subunit